MEDLPVLIPALNCAPTIAGVVEVEGGCRVYLMMTDASRDEVRLDLPVELTFRKMHDAGGKPNYFWKATPITCFPRNPPPSPLGEGLGGEAIREAGTKSGASV
jgi:hypothetical protein